MNVNIRIISPPYLLQSFLGVLPLFIFFATIETATATERCLLADFRHRPPEMVITDNQRSGPLKIILEEAASQIGYKIKWRNAHFARSLNDLKQGKIDIIPRMIKNVQRGKYTFFLGPIGFQEKDILFLVRKGQENLINSYDDLQGLEIEVKRKTAYFDKFDSDTSLLKRENLDDNNMAKMFKHQRFDTMPVLDRFPLETALKKIGMEDYTYANYKYVNKIGNYYGFSKNSPNTPIQDKLNQSLLQLTCSGRVAKIYMDFGLTPPARD